MKMQIKRICIYQKTLSASQARLQTKYRRVQAIRKSLNKLENELVTIEEFCQYAG
jgi:cell division protein FtsB